MVLISLISLRRLLRQRRFVSFRLLFLATTQRVSRCSLPSLRGRGWGEGHFYVFYYLCHYDFCPLCHSGFCLLVTLSFTYSAPYVFMSFWLLPPCYSVFTYSVHYVLLASVPLLPCLLHTQSLRSLCLLFLCYHVFTYSAPYVFMSFWLHKCKVFLLTSYFVGNL